MLDKYIVLKREDKLWVIETNINECEVDDLVLDSKAKGYRKVRKVIKEN